MTTVYWDVSATPVGLFYVARTPEGIFRSMISSPQVDGQAVDFLALPGMTGAVHDPELFGPVREWVAAYFAGQILPALPALDLRGVTLFQARVYAAVTAIPVGETRTYGDIARELNQPRAARAVGAANGRNPLPLIIPCHRLVGRDGSLRGYGSGAGIVTKQWLLDHEQHVAHG